MKPDTEPLKKTNRRILVIGAVLLLVVASAVIVAWHYNAHQNAWGKINFQEYAPSYLPDKLGTVGKSIVPVNRQKMRFP